MVHVPWDAYNYQLASGKNPFLFIIARETTYNLARLIFVPLIIFFFAIDFHPFVIAFALAAGFSLLYAAVTKNARQERTPENAF